MTDELNEDGLKPEETIDELIRDPMDVIRRLDQISEDEVRQRLLAQLPPETLERISEIYEALGKTLSENNEQE